MLKTCHDRFKSSAVATIRGDRARGVVGVAIATKPLNGHCTTLATWRLSGRATSSSHTRNTTAASAMPTSMWTCRTWHFPRATTRTGSSRWPSVFGCRAKAATKRKRIEKKVGDLFQHRYLFVQHVLTPAERRTLVRITRGQAELRTLRGVMDEVYRLFDRRCRSETALEKLARLRRRVRRFKRVGKTLQKLFSPNLEKALTFLDDKLLPSTSNAVERGNRRHRKMQDGLPCSYPTSHLRTNRLGHGTRRAHRTTESDDQIAPRGSYPQGRMIPGNDAIDSLLSLELPDAGCTDEFSPGFAAFFGGVPCAAGSLATSSPRQRPSRTSDNTMPNVAAKWFERMASLPFRKDSGATPAIRHRASASDLVLRFAIQKLKTQSDRVARVEASVTVESVYFAPVAVNSLAGTARIDPRIQAVSHIASKLRRARPPRFPRGL